MRHFIFLVLVMGFSLSTLGQILEKPPFNITIHDYPHFFGKEIHSSLNIELYLMKTLRAELNVFYDTYLLENRMRNSITLKQEVLNGFYVLTGVSTERVVGQSLIPLKRTPRYGLLTGFGYKLNEDLLLEAKRDFSINNAGIGAFGEPLIIAPEVYTISGKLKF